MDSGDVNRLLGDAGIIRHRGKIESTINNANVRWSCGLSMDRSPHISGAGNLVRDPVHVK
jgi:hypothetical protein